MCVAYVLLLWISPKKIILNMCKSTLQSQGSKKTPAVGQWWSTDSPMLFPICHLEKLHKRNMDSLVLTQTSWCSQYTAIL